MPRSRVPRSRRSSTSRPARPKPKIRHPDKARNPALKRHLVPNELVPKMKSILKEKLARDKSFFKSLPSAKINIDSYCPIRVFDFNGTKGVIKQTLGINEHGNTPKWIREDLLAHQNLVRKKEINNDQYVLFTPRIYFQIGSYIVMEHIENAERQFRLDPNRSPQLIQARKQLKENLAIASKNSQMGRPLQTHHFMVTGVSRGKLVFFAPYDHEAR